MGNSIQKLSKLVAAAAAASALMAAPLAFAGSGDPLLPSLDNAWLSVTSGTSGGNNLLPSSIENDGSNDFSASGSKILSGYSIGWDLVLNPDPYIDGSITIANLSGTAQNFTVSLSLPVTPSFSPGVMGGSIDATVFDQNNSGSATLQWQGSPSNPAPIYFGTIDGGNTLLMFAQSVTCSGAGCSGNSSESQMPPSISVPGGVTTKIGTKLVFNLSAGDKVTFLTHFEVDPVPLPASAWLLGSALLGIAGIRRRK